MPPVAPKFECTSTSNVVYRGKERDLPTLSYGKQWSDTIMAPPPPRQVFGQTMRKKKRQQGGGGGGGRSNYQRQFGGSHKSNPSTVYRSAVDDSQQHKSQSESTAAEYRRQKTETAKQVEADFGIERFILHNDNQQSSERRGWLYNVVPTTVCFCLIRSLAGLFVCAFQ